MRPLTIVLLGTTTVTALSLPSLLSQKASVLRSYIQVPFTSQPKMSNPSNAQTSTSSGLFISDVLSQTQKVNIFAGLTRDIDPISDRLDSSSHYSTILAPLNSAIQALEHKPWEDESDIQAFGSGSEAYRLGDGEQRANENLRRFVERHIVPKSPWEAGDKVETLAGGKIWWEEKNGERFIMPGSIKVASVATHPENGEVWVLEGVLRK